ncbi:MAG: right-handed parallel beta-helix repeat-containing protein [Alphaproteobacteria bacterium]
MFASRALMALLVFALISTVVFFKFHGFFIQTGSKAMREIVLEKGNPVEPGEYAAKVMSGRAPAGVAALPDVAGFTVENIEREAPAFAPGKINVRDMIGLPGLREFIKKDGRVQRLRLSQGEVNPLAIVVESGKYDFRRLVEETDKIRPGLIVRKGDKYLIRAPILVQHGAALVISGKDSDEYLLSKDQTVFIANAGDLYVLRARITGWDEKTNGPALFEDRKSFRPFLVSWTGGRMYLAGSSFSHLGYRKGKSYGLTYSSCQPCLDQKADLPRPTGAIVGNTFTALYYGLYTYEADDIAIVGNTYADNIIYGIDPHDRSRRLIIANNEVYGSGKKHGIIISRDVDDSWIFGNNSHHNVGSGIMIDRQSRNNIIANNVSAHNGGDGMTFFESPDNVIYGNQIYRNKMSGIRIRNSWNLRFFNDQIADNGRVAVVVYAASLAESQKDRDLKMDPYSVRAGADFTDTVFKLAEGKPAFKVDGAERLALSGVHLLSGDAVFAGRLFAADPGVLRGISENARTVVVENKVAKNELQ